MVFLGCREPGGQQQLLTLRLDGGGISALLPEDWIPGRLLAPPSCRRRHPGFLCVRPQHVDMARMRRRADSNAEVVLSKEEKLLRERMRMQSTGITSFTLHQQSEKLLFPLGGRLFVFHLSKPVSHPTASPRSDEAARRSF